MSKPAPARFKTTNWAKYDAALKARGFWKSPSETQGIWR